MSRIHEKGVCKDEGQRKEPGKTGRAIIIMKKVGVGQKNTATGGQKDGRNKSGSSVKQVILRTNDSVDYMMQKGLIKYSEKEGSKRRNEKIK